MESIDYGRIAELDAATAWSDLRRSIRLILSNLKSKVGTAQKLSVPQAQMWHERAQLDIGALQKAIVEYGSRHSWIRRQYE
ncbi:hypothetical protein [Pseudomonas sp. zfem005]|uniref:hypothetical protein n=1 Tax=Pseudomonas sp. zfem005 TaxID=3078200 RepID=UPI0029299AD6|nr:hypothetical protein [Pseudomonas sp. zfem005]MDU9415190.1 hypothetical protein [Pseudomonas sp. zfem005]